MITYSERTHNKRTHHNVVQDLYSFEFFSTKWQKKDDVYSDMKEILVSWPNLATPHIYVDRKRPDDSALYKTNIEYDYVVLEPKSHKIL